MDTDERRTFPEPDPERQDGAPRKLAPELLRLNYQNRLRSIGRSLDLGGYRTMIILEVEGGFVVRTVRRQDRDIELLEFADSTYPERMIQATESRGAGERREKASPIAPTGYEDLLRAVGRQADLRKLERIVIAELRDGLVLAGDDCSGARPRPVDYRLSMETIQKVLDEAFQQRGRAAGNQGA